MAFMRLVFGCVTAFGLALTSFPSVADTLSTKSRKDIFLKQSKVLDTRAATQYRDSERLKPKTPKPQLVKRYNGKYKGEFVTLARQAARKHNVPEDLFLRLVQQESGWNAGAVSHKGALGLAQLMPGTAQQLGVNPHDPKQNLEGGARYLSWQYRKFKSWPLALAAYNAGPGAVEKHGGIPPYKETQNYVRVIWGG